MFFRSIICLVLVGCVIQSSGQDHMISLSGEYNMPLGELDWSYKSASGVQLHYMVLNHINRRWTRHLGLGFGYTRFNNNADTLYYVIDKGGVQGLGLGTAVYSPFKIYIFSATLGASRHISKTTDLSLGLNVGYHYGKRQIEFKDEFGGESGVDELTGRGSLVPRLGVLFRLNEVVSLIPFVSYTFMVELGSTDPADTFNYNPDTGAFLNYYSTGLSVNFSF